MIVVCRLAVPPEESASFPALAEAALSALSARPGYLRGHLGRAVDDPSLWLLSTEWLNVGAYRRALSAYDVKMTLTTAMAHAVNEPSAFEVVLRTLAAVSPEDGAR